MTKKQSGRKRWGGGLSDTWDDFDDLDFGIPRKQKAAPLKPMPAIGKRAEDRKENLFKDDEDDFLALVDFLSIIPVKSCFGRTVGSVQY